MAAKVRTPAGKALYARRKVIVEPVFGQIKEARGFRRFLLRGVEKIRGEWRLVCLTHNLLKLWRYGSAHSTAEDRRTPSGDGQGLVSRGRTDRNRSWRSQDEVKDGSHRDPQATKHIEKSYGS
jgi:Transposase DDE domain